MSNSTQTLHINVQTGTTQPIELPDNLLNEYLGGRGLTSSLLYMTVPPDLSARSPKMPLYIAAGTLSGTPVFSATTLTITTRSLLTANLSHSWAVGEWARKLKLAGYSLLSLIGQASDWIYIVINNQGIEIRSATPLMGLDTLETTNKLKEILGVDYSILSIGPAGEKALPLAAAVIDGRFMAEPVGTGASFGLKKIKAIAVHGTNVQDTVQRVELEAALHTIKERIETSELAAAMRQFGSSYYLNLMYDAGALTPRNGQEAIFTRFLALARSTLAARGKLDPHGCLDCPMPCYSDFARQKGDPLPRPELEALAGFGVRCGISNIDTIIAANNRCLRLGLDINATASTIAFMIECRQKGMTSQYDLNWGDDDVILKTIEAIANKEGIGGLLSLGPGEMSQIFYGSQDFAPIVKNLPMSPIDPRAAQGWALQLQTSNIGGDARYAMPFYEWLSDLPPWLQGEGEHAPAVIEGKVARLMWHERFSAALDAVGMCRRLTFLAYQLSPQDLANILSAQTGVPITPAELAKIGERIITIERLCAIQWTGSNRDNLPKRWSNESLTQGPSANRLPDTDLLQRYYSRHGWDTEGHPLPDRLTELKILPPEQRSIVES